MHETLANAINRKSQLAVEYSYRLQGASPSTWVFWVHASSTARFLEGYNKIAERVNPLGWDKSEADVFFLVYNWLSDEDNGRWLMIIDNADDMEVFTSTTTRGKGTEDDMTSKPTTVLLNMIPQSSNGAIIITSRSRDVAFRLTGDYADIIHINPMDQGEAVALLQNQLKANFDKDTSAQIDAESLVEALDHMPLAISQAASYISRRSPRATVAKYMQDLHKDDQTRSGLLRVDLGDTRRDGTASYSIIATWQISFEHLRTEMPSAPRLLSLRSLFHRQGIPEPILQDYYLSVIDGDATFEDDLTKLLSFSLIATDIDGSHFQMHRLVQFSTIKWLEMHKELEHWKDAYAVLIEKHYLDVENEIGSSYRTLFPHAQAAVVFRPTSDRALKSWASLLYKAMADAYHIGSYQLNALGEEHPYTLFSYCNLGTVLHAQGKYSEAETTHRQALEKRREVLGVKHPHTVSSMHNLALTLKELDYHANAITIMERCYRLRKGSLGVLHPDTVKSRNILHAWTSQRYDDTSGEPTEMNSVVNSTFHSGQHRGMRTPCLFALALLGAIGSLLLISLLACTKSLK